MKSMNPWRQRCAVVVGLMVALVLTLTPAAADPPATSGVVVRGTFNAALWWVDAREGTLIVTGVDIVDWCTGPAPFDTFSFQDAELRDRINTIQKGQDITTSVWPFDVLDCFLFTTLDPLATGLTEVVWPDSDLVLSGDQAYAGSIMVRGFLTTPDGARARLDAHFHETLDANGGYRSNQRIILR